MKNTYTAELMTINHEPAIMFEFWQGEECVESKTFSISSEKWDDIDKGFDYSDSINIPGYDMIENECDGSSRHGTWTRELKVHDVIVTSKHDDQGRFFVLRVQVDDCWTAQPVDNRLEPNEIRDYLDAFYGRPVKWDGSVVYN